MCVKIEDIKWGTMDLKKDRFEFGRDPDNDCHEIQLLFTKGAARQIGSLLLQGARGEIGSKEEDAPVMITMLGRITSY